NGIAPVDRLGESHLFGSGQQLVAADVGQEELEAVCGAREHVLLGRLGGLLLLRLLLCLECRLTHLEPDALELAGQFLDLVLVQVVLEGEGLELCRLEVPTLLGTLDECLGLVGIKQFVKLVLCQLSLSALTLWSAANLRTVSGLPFSFQGEPPHGGSETGTRPCPLLFRRRRLFGLRTHGKLELDLVLVVQDEPRTKRFAVP